MRMITFSAALEQRYYARHMPLCYAATFAEAATPSCPPRRWRAFFCMHADALFEFRACACERDACARLRYGVTLALRYLLPPVLRRRCRPPARRPEISRFADTCSALFEAFRRCIADFRHYAPHIST
jgi:hypothetical protein